MKSIARIIALVFVLLTATSHAEHVIVTGGPALRKWENYRTSKDQHDRWWANFVRASTLRMAEVRKAFTVFVDPGARKDDGSIDPAKVRISISHENDF